MKLGRGEVRSQICDTRVWSGTPNFALTNVGVCCDSKKNWGDGVTGGGAFTTDKKLFLVGYLAELGQVRLCFAMMRYVN